MTRWRCAAATAAFLVAVSTSSLLGQTAQKRPHPLIEAYAGSVVDSDVTVSDFDEYRLLVGKLVPGKPEPVKTVEGKVTMFRFRNPTGRSALEVFRNYETAFTQAGFSTVYSCRGEECGPQRQIKGLAYVPYAADARYAVFSRTNANGVVHVATHISVPSAYFVIVEGKPMETGMAKVT